MKPIFIFLFSMLFAQESLAQAEPEIALILLGNDHISEVNTDTDKFIKSFSPVMDLIKTEFKSFAKSQSADVFITVHKAGLPTLKLQSKPQLDKKTEISFLSKLSAIKLENTKLVDMPMLVRVNGPKNAEEGVERYMLHVIRSEEYKQASLKQKYELNRKWATREVLPVLAAYEIAAEKFEGVSNFGKTVAAADFSKPQDIEKMTGRNPDYWRAVMEMGRGNQLIPITKIFMLASQGYLDSAERYSEIISMYTTTESAANLYLEEFNWRMRVLSEDLTKEVDKGIAFHDKGEYEKALGVYEKVKQAYPYSAWNLYEIYFSKNAMDIVSGKVKAGDRTQWDEAKKGIYGASPLYNMDVIAATGKEAYLLFRRQQISSLFRTKGNTAKDTYEYADIALDLGVYDFAAQLFWLSFTFEKDEKAGERSLHRYLYVLEKLGVPQWKSNFKGDFDKIFKAIDKERQEAMEGSAVFKSMKK